MPRTPPTAAQDFVPIATAALDLHRALNLPASEHVVRRAELDSLHAHLVSLHALLDVQVGHADALSTAAGRELAAARLRVWQAAERLHAAYHAAQRNDGSQPQPSRPPSGMRQLTICQRHRRATILARRRTTPTDLTRP